MAKTDMTIAEQLERAAEALDQMVAVKNTAAKEANGEASGIESWKAVRQSSSSSSSETSPAPEGSLSAALLRTDGLLRTGSN